jgi:secreted PhoX family phosphatase
MSDSDISIFTRMAATQVGATTMDRPEWVAANPNKVEAYCALTNNKNRGVKPNQPVNAVNPRVENPYGQIVRWTPDNNEHAADGFKWDLFAMAGNPVVGEGLMKGSENITKDNMFNSPDGIAFDSKGNLWIQTDGKYTNQGAFEGMGNNQMLCANPRTGKIDRFLVGPKECEITGITWSSDKKTMFVGVQHPGENNPDKCHFPDGGSSVPRSAIVAISRNDGKTIG